MAEKYKVVEETLGSGIKQYHIEAKYKWLTISGTLDRYNKEKKLIRDWKTSWNIENIEWDIENTFDYVTSMSFYYVLWYLNDWFESDVLLDIVSKNWPYTSMIYRLTTEKLRKKMNNYIKPELEKLSQCLETNNREFKDRYEAMNSPYYPILSSANINDIVDSN